MPRFTALIDKIGRNELLSAGELSELRQIGADIDEVISAVKSWLPPGSSNPRFREVSVDNVQIANRDVSINEFGVFFKNQEGLITFQDTDGNYGILVIYGDGNNEMVIANRYGSEGIRFDIDTASHDVIGPTFTEDPSLAERAYAWFPPGAQGSRVEVGTDLGILIDAYGGSGGFNAISMNESVNTPDNPSQDTQGRIYFKENKVIFQWNDGGTVRYKFLDLTGVGVTWQHSTSAP